MYEGVLYPTVEHAYHCLRYTDQRIIEEIRGATSPSKAWEVSQGYKSEQSPDFKERKVLVMKELLRTKAEQHDDVRRALMESGDSLIVKHIVTGSPPDGFWDDGEDGTGENMTGKLWMEIRDEMKMLPS